MSASASAAGAAAGVDADWVDRDFLRAEEEALGRAVVDDIVAVFRAQGQTLVAALIAGRKTRHATHEGRPTGRPSCFPLSFRDTKKNPRRMGEGFASEQVFRKAKAGPFGTGLLGKSPWR